MKKNHEIKYVEPADYFPKEIREKFFKNESERGTEEESDKSKIPEENTDEIRADRFTWHAGDVVIRDRDGNIIEPLKKCGKE